MKKLLKGVVAVVVVIVVVLLAALILHPLWMGPLVKTVVTNVGPKFTGTPIALTDCGINLYSGHIELSGFDLANPQGCSEQTATGVSSLKVDLDTLSVLSDIINVRSIEVSGIFVSYVKGASGKYNFTEISSNAKAASGETSEEKKAEPKPEEKAESEQKSGKKVVIERLSVGNVRVSAFGVKATILPGSIVLTDIGKKSNGATLEEVWAQTSDKVLDASGAAGKQLKAAWSAAQKYGQQGIDLGKKGLDLGQKGIDAGTDGVKKALDSAKNLDMQGTKDALKSAGDGLKSVGNELKDVGKGLKGLFGK